MGLEAAFHNLRASLDELRAALSDLRLTVVEDEPAKGATKIAEEFGMILEEMIGEMSEALIGARNGEQFAAHPRDMAGAHRELVGCHHRALEVGRRFVERLANQERMDQLTRSSNTRKGAWRSWCKIIRQGIDGCLGLHYDLQLALFECWQELVDRSGTCAISMQVSNVGQKIGSS